MDDQNETQNEPWGGHAERRAPQRQKRSARVVVGTGAGGIGSLIGVLAAFAWHEYTGREMGDQVAIAIGGLLGAFSSTFAICVHDVRDMLWALLGSFKSRRRK